MGSIWGHLGFTLRSFSANEETLEPYLSHFDVEKLEMASVMGICGSLVGPKSGNVEKVLVFNGFFNGSGGPRGGQDHERPSEKRRLGGGSGRVNPPPCGLV